jgi:hypothetical protein
MWNPFRKRSRAEIHSLVLKNPETGLNEVHLILTMDDIAEAADAIAGSFKAVISRHRSDPDFGGQVVFVVRGPVAGTELPPELVLAQSQVQAKTAGLETTKGRPFHARVEYKQSAW